MTQIPPSIAEIDAQAPIQARIWRVSKIAWWGMGAVLMLAAIGLFGDGPLAEEEAMAGDGSLRVTYDRFQRADASSPFILRTSHRQADGNVAFCLDRAFLDVWQMSQMEPSPLREEAHGEDVCHVIAVPPGMPAPVFIKFWAHARMGSLSAEGRLRMPGGESVRLRALVWP